jgi:hypothetical protein
MLRLARLLLSVGSRLYLHDAFCLIGLAGVLPRFYGHLT